MRHLLAILFLLCALPAFAQPRTVTINTVRPTTAGTALSLFRANPVTFSVRLDATRPALTGVESLTIEIRQSVTDTDDPLAVTTIDEPSGAGPFTLELTGAQMNQDLDGAASATFWIVIYTADDEGETLDVLYTAPLSLKEHGASQAAAAPPAAVGPLARAVIPLEFIPLLDATAHAAGQIDNRLDGLTASDSTKEIFSTATHTGTPSYIRSLTCWAADIDLTGVGVWNSQYGVQIGFTAISPEHVVICDHATIANGTTLRWVTAGNVIVERTLTASTLIASTDVRVGTLSSALPDTIAPVKLLSSTYTSGLSAIGPALFVDQEKKALVGETASATTIYTPDAAQRASFYETPITGDSGNPWLVIIEGQPTLRGMFWYADSGSNIPSLAADFASLAPTAEFLDLPRTVDWAALTSKPAFTSAATTAASTTPAAGIIPLTDGTGKIPAEFITSGATTWSAVTGKPFTTAASEWTPANSGSAFLVSGGTLNVSIDAGYSDALSVSIPSGSGFGGSAFSASGFGRAFQATNAESPSTITGTGNLLSFNGTKLVVGIDGRLTWTESAARTATRASLFTSTPTYANDAAAAADGALASGSPYLITGSTALHLKP